ncbi:MAG TPA: DUF4383 domain-containing protein [Burkholderiales bacterium]|nr:DUF4383 domain-containing protein [Burkholderiales bacterium]
MNSGINARHFALVFGIAYLGAGVLGLMPGVLAPLPADAPPVRFDVLHGALLGLFPVNMLHTLVHLAIGAWGIAAFMGMASTARVYARSLAVIYGVLGVMGLIPGLNTLFGLVPLHGHDVWLHLGTAAIAAYFGFRGEEGTERRRNIADRRVGPRTPIANERRQGMYDRRRGAATTIPA